MTLSIIVPAYNSGDKIEKLIKRIKNVNFGKLETEIIVVNDASPDNTYEVLKKINEITLLSHKINTGKGGAVATGLKRAKGDILFIQDDDLEYDPKDIPKIIKPILEQKSEVVYGSRRLNKKNSYSSPLYLWGGVFVDTIISLIIRYPLTDAITGSKAFTRNVYDAIKPIETEGFDIEAEITAKIVKAGYKPKEIAITYSPRNHKQGKNIHWHHAFAIFFAAIKYSYFR